MARIQIVLDDEIDNKFRNFLAKRGGLRKGDFSEEIENLIKRVLSEGEKSDFVIQNSAYSLNEKTEEQIKVFCETIKTLEKNLSKPLIIMMDGCIEAFYTECHILAKDLIDLMDLDPSIDPDEQEKFRSNRIFEPANTDYLVMVEDAIENRQFSDIVIEYNPNLKYSKPNKPLKVFGGQHRCHAIEEALKKGVNRYHGIKVYFNLNIEQRKNIAIISNTNIQVSSDLRDRMAEQALKPANKLRDFCYEIGILDKSKQEDFTSKKSKESGITIRMLRTFIINFYEGIKYKGNFDNDAIVPPLTEAGSIDKKYLDLYKTIDFCKEIPLIESGKNFVKLHKKQMEYGKGKSKFISLTLAIPSSWSYATGLLQKDKGRLKKLYDLPDLSGDKEPLNSEALAHARGGKDPDNYRGLVTRYGEKERGRLLQIFLYFSRSPKTAISSEICKVGVNAYDTKKLSKEFREQEKRVL